MSSLKSFVLGVLIVSVTLLSLTACSSDKKGVGTEKKVTKAEYENWLDKDNAERAENDVFPLDGVLKITEIHNGFFFASSIHVTPYEIKINGSLESRWCKGDTFTASFKNVYLNEEKHRIEADLAEMKEADYVLSGNGDEKPVIYLYPESETMVSVHLDYKGEIFCTYPEYRNGWTVTASPDGTLTDAKGQTYNYLYWEGKNDTVYDFSKGFCVKGEDTAAFLETALDRLGLTRKEANEFIVFWLPKMQDNPYNIIAFQSDAYTDSAKLEISPKPDTLIRVFMAWRPSDSFVDIEPQTLTAPERNGFVAVEWGGSMR